jgi:tryptophanyl-tRNA synthetase
VQELTWFLSTFTPMGLLERCHSYKDKVARGIAANHALFAYPVLMTADILLFQSERVPVGKDQKQHLEVARDIAIKVNNHFGELFVVPEAEIDEEVATVPGLDGQKMSKSYGNTIDLFLEEKSVAQAGDAHRHRPDTG